MDISNKNNNIGFGTAFILFNNADLAKLTPKAQKTINKCLKPGSKIEQVTDNFIRTKSKSGRFVATNTEAGVTGIHYTNMNPKKELKLLDMFMNLFGNTPLKVNIISNKPEYAPHIERAKNALQTNVFVGII